MTSSYVCGSESHANATCFLNKHLRKQVSEMPILHEQKITKTTYGTTLPWNNIYTSALSHKTTTVSYSVVLNIVYLNMYVYLYNRIIVILYVCTLL